MNKSADNRLLKDRRKIKIKQKIENRQELRRQEDRENIVSYYVVLGLSIGVLLILGIASHLYE